MILNLIADCVFTQNLWNFVGASQGSDFRVCIGGNIFGNGNAEQFGAVGNFDDELYQIFQCPTLTPTNTPTLTPTTTPTLTPTANSY